jgi:prepilin-type N-terminal cleavage/methylation domain-containing protein
MKSVIAQQKKSGFTLIEMIVSLALFTIVSTVTVGALLSLIGGNQRLLKQQTLTSSAIFSLDNMTREIRTGNYYYCPIAPSNFANQSNFGTSTQDCLSGSTGISFIESSPRHPSGRVAYYFAPVGGPGTATTLWRRIGNGTATRLLPDDVSLTSTSRFFVTDTATLTGGTNNVRQPTVMIVMVLAATDSTPETTLQTTITQRSLDI